jgi:uncharacterized protein VirK/YbjX
MKFASPASHAATITLKDSTCQKPHFFTLAKVICAAAIALIRNEGIRSSIIGISARLFLASDESILVTIIRFLEIFRVMIQRNTIALTMRHPSLLFKYRRDYLAKSFNRASRRQILTFHYKYMADVINDGFYEQLFNGNPCLWQKTIDKELVAISLGFNPKYSSEGDVSLILEKDLVSLYELSFTIVPGALIGAETPEALLVARMQGRRRLFEAIKHTTKICQDVAPPYLLMAAVQGVANALGIKIVAGVPTDDQLSRKLMFNYDALWETFLATKTVRNFYVILIPFSHKPLEQINSAHRRRTRSKREFRNQITESAGNYITSFMMRIPSGSWGRFTSRDVSV